MFCQKCGAQNPDNGRFCRSCGSDLGNAAAAAPSTQLQQPNVYIDHRGRTRSADPEDLWSNAVRNSLMGVGFFIISMLLLITDVARGQRWWWAMLFPAFSLLATGLSQYVRVRRIETRKSANLMQQNQFTAAPQNQALPSTQPEYVQPQSRSIYDTGEFEMRPPSVTEGTTRHLEVNKEGETMTLPKDIRS